MVKKRWTAQEDTIVVSAVKDSPTNLKTAFKAASKKIVGKWNNSEEWLKFKQRLV